MKPARLAAIALALGLTALIGRDGAATGGPQTLAPRFAETGWPFLLDAWGPGRAFACGADACGSPVAVFVRPKSGFCNCYNGVEDDDEIDRIGDVDLHSRDFVPLAPGRPARVGGMDGRTRAFMLSANAAREVRAVVVATKCNALVATIASDGPLAPAVEGAVLDLLNGGPVQQFIATASVSP